MGKARWTDEQAKQNIGRADDVLFPELFAPLSTELIYRLVHIPISLPMALGVHCTFWRAYIGSNLGHGLAVSFMTTCMILVAYSSLSRERDIRYLFAS